MEQPESPRVRPVPPAAPARESLAQAAYAALKASILEGLLPPGHEAVEQAIADQLGMSRTPVHEAALRLQHEGFLQVLPRRGLRVLPIDPVDLRETYDILIALEGAAAALLAGRGAAGAEALATMQEATEAMARALAAGDRKAWAAADDRFHRTLLRASGNARLARLAQTAADQAQRARSATAARREDPAASVAEHAAILAALKAGAPEPARAAVAAHRSRASEDILRVLGGVPR
ncbi:GntR family transcriptional regulator [Dankookia sp. GCM10030260]|uniref:GntR family transcriptional regulator n=1 Tax=Dankookia sp. GCM10030260 TaxID=3273390 RepID=UPI0036213A7D